MAKKGLLSRLLGGVSSVVKKTAWFDAGQYGRRLRGVPTSQVSVNELIKRYGKTIVARSRWLTANNPYASAAKDAFTTAFVGSGIKPSSLVTDANLKKAIQDLWLDWTDETDADGLTDFYGQQSIIAGEIFEAGECFVRFRPRLPQDGLTVPLQLQILPAEMLDLNYNTTLGENIYVECGIEFGPIGDRRAYWFWKFHPNAPVPLAQGNDRTRVPASEVMHLFKPRQAGQIRGIPHTLPSIVRTAIFDLYDDAELERKKTAALFVGAIQRDLPETDPDAHPLENSLPDEDRILQQQFQGRFPTGSTASLEPGALFDLQPGEKMVFSDPADVGATYEPFQLRNLLAIAAGYGVTYADMTGDLRQTSYGSIRAGLVQFRRKVEQMQHQIMVYQLCRPVWLRFLAESVLAGALVGVTPSTFKIKFRELIKVKWIPPRWDWIDPLKDRQAERLAVRAGFKSLSDVIEAEGYDPEETFTRIEQERQLAKDKKLIFDSDAAFTSTAGVGQPSGSAPLDDEPAVDATPATDDPSVDTPPVDALNTRAEARADRLENLLEEIRDGQIPTEPDPVPIINLRPVINLSVKTPRGKQKTVITAHDSAGRILETETTFEEDEPNG